MIVKRTSFWSCRRNGGLPLFNMEFFPKYTVYSVLFLVSFCTCFQNGVTDNFKDTTAVINRCSVPSWSLHYSEIENDNVKEDENWTFVRNENASQVLQFKMRNLQPNCSFGEIYINWTRNSDDAYSDYSGGDTIYSQYKFWNLTAKGELIWQDSDGFFHTSLPHSYCVDLDSENETSAFRFRICKSGCTVQEPCVRKCCPPDSILDPKTRTCNQTTKIWKPFFYTAANHKADEPEGYEITYGFSTCQKKYFIQLFKTANDNDEYVKLNLLLNGSLLQINGKTTELKPGQFCIDGYPYHDQNSHGKLNYSGSEWDQVAVICAPPPPSKLVSNVQRFKRIFTAVLLTFSAFCLLLTDIVYLILWKYKNIHEWLQFSCATAFFFAFSTLAIVLVGTEQIRDISPDWLNLCKILGSLIHFSFLSAFFWMTSMNFDLWLRFSGCRPLKIRSKPTGDKKKFLFFALFSLGFPFLFALCAVTMDHIYEHNPDAAPIPIPEFGVMACYFSKKRVEFPYAKGPELILFLINIMFFISTVVHLRRYQKNTELARTNSNSEDKRGKFRLFSKLFVVMGVLWIFEFISWSIDVSFPENQILNILLFLPTDALNSLQGVAIFIIYVCKPNIFNQLKTALGFYSLTTSTTPAVKQIPTPS